MAGKVLAVLEFVDSAAIRALGLPRMPYVEINLGVAVPNLHVRQGAGAKHAPLMVQVFGQ